MNHDVFISYSSQDMEAAQAICHVLEQNEIRCWVASRNIPPGSDYGDVIEEAIKACRAVVLLFSETSATSQWVKGELNIAFEEQKTIIPFRLDQTPLKGQTRVMLNQRHWIDAYPDYKTKFNDLVTAVAKSIGKESITDSPTPTSQFYTSSRNEKKLEENRESKHIVPNRQRVVLIATLVCLLVAFFGIGTYIIKKGITHNTINATATDIHTPLDSLFNIVQERRLEETDIESINKHDLLLLRNSIYARHGYRFLRDDLFDYFSKFSWYRPTTSNTSGTYDTMSDIEKYNINFIKKHE